jgi:hypothetical protein
MIIGLVREAEAAGHPAFASAITNNLQVRCPWLWATMQEFSRGDPYQTLMPFVERIIREGR